MTSPTLGMTLTAMQTASIQLWEGDIGTDYDERPMQQLAFVLKACLYDQQIDDLADLLSNTQEDDDALQE